MDITLNRKQLTEILRHRDTSNIRQAIKRGSLIEDTNKLINLKNPANRNWLQTQIQAGRQKGFIIDLDFETKPSVEGIDEKTNSASKNQLTKSDVDTNLKLARTEMVKEQIKTAQLNREIALGNYLRTSDIIEAVTIYLDQTMNIANTNLGNAATRICNRHSIKKPDEIVKIKSELTDDLNMAIEDGRKEVMKCVERMVLDQVEKLAKK